MNARNILICGTLGVAVSSLDAGCSARGGRQAHHESLPPVTNVFPTDRPADATALPRALSVSVEGPITVASVATSSAAAAVSTPAAGTLVLYDDTGPYGWLGELYAVAAANLAGHFGAWHAKPVSTYAAGDMLPYQAAVYVGSTYDQPLPAAFLDDVVSGARPVVWMYDNIWQLAARYPDFLDRYGYVPWQFDTSPIAQVNYKGQQLTRYSANGAGIMELNPFDASKVTVLASAVRADGTTLPWAVRSQNLTYIGEIPFAYLEASDRYLAFCDILFDVLAPATTERHRALVRIEDVSAETDPVAMQAIDGLLLGQGIPFSIALIPVFTDPNGTYNDAVPLTEALGDSPEILSVLQSLQQRGATIVMHGYTHQYGAKQNPYTGASADDFEFYTAHVDANDYVVYDGPVPEDSAGYAQGRVDAGLAELAKDGLGHPAIFEYPHYAGSAVDSRTLAGSFGTVYHRGLYFGGALTGGPDQANDIGQFFPYAVTDVFGWHVIPENLGNYEPEALNHNPPRTADDLVNTGKSNLVVRDGVASFFFHPEYDVSVLGQIVDGLRALGYTFVGPDAL